MKFVVWLGLSLLVSANAFAQRGGSAHGGSFGGGGRGGFGAFGSSRFGRFNNRFGSQFGAGFYPYGFFDWDYDYGYPPSYGYPPENPYPPAGNNTVVVQPVQPMYGPPPMMQAAGPVTHTYTSGTPGGATDGGRRNFVIAMTDGSRVEAEAVWTQDRVLHYIDQDEVSRQAPLASVDRRLTRTLNQDRNLTLRLPPP